VVAYLDSSVILRHILLGEIAIQHALDCDRVVASELVEIECRRVLHRYRMDGNLNDDGFLAGADRLRSVIDGITLLALTRSVKQRAMGAFPVSVKTLDALHLASALAYADSFADQTVLMFTHDVAMNRCAAALGFAAPFAQ
jgi:predicted nucleic acid-binding protein